MAKILLQIVCDLLQKNPQKSGGVFQALGVQDLIDFYNITFYFLHMDVVRILFLYATYVGTGFFKNILCFIKLSICDGGKCLLYNFFEILIVS